MSIKVYSKFIIVGVTCVILNYGLYYFLCTETSINYLLASIIGYFFGFAAGFILNNNWTFGYRKFSVKKIVGYFVVYFSSLCISSFLLWIMVGRLHFNALLANLISIGISTASNFFGLNYIIYKENALTSETLVTINGNFK